MHKFRTAARYTLIVDGATVRERYVAKSSSVSSDAGNMLLWVVNRPYRIQNFMNELTAELYVLRVVVASAFS